MQLRLLLYSWTSNIWSSRMASLHWYSSKRSLECVLLHIGSIFGAIPIGHSVHLKERYEDIKIVLDLLKYEEHKWIICVDLKMANFLLEQQSGYTKFPYSLCLWNSRAKDSHWIQKEWQVRECVQVGQNNIINEPLVKREKLVSLHIRLGLMKQVVKALSTESDCFKYLFTALPGITFEKLKAAIFNGHQLRKLMNDRDFIKSMKDSEKKCMGSICLCCTKLPCKQKTKQLQRSC